MRDETKVDGSIDYPAYCIQIELRLLRRFAKKHWRYWRVDDELWDETLGEIDKMTKQLRDRAVKGTHEDSTHIKERPSLMSFTNDENKRSWFYLNIPNPPEDAPHAQRMEHAAITGLLIASSRGGTYITRVLRLAIASYMRCWHPGVEIPEI